MIGVYPIMICPTQRGALLQWQKTVLTNRLELTEKHYNGARSCIKYQYILDVSKLASAVQDVVLNSELKYREGIEAGSHTSSAVNMR